MWSAAVSELGPEGVAEGSSLLWAAAGVVLGACLGSFFATLVVRWPTGLRVGRGRSRCDACGRPLGSAELVPILSALALRNRCRSCGTGINPAHLWIELMAALWGGLMFLLFPPVPAAALAVLGWLLLPLAWLDASHLWLPDLLTGALAVAGLLLGPWLGWAGLADRLIGGAVAFFALAGIALAYRRWRGREGLGLGDAKLFGAIGLWTGWTALPLIMSLASGMGLLDAVRRGALAKDPGALPLGTYLAVATAIWAALSLF